MNEPNAELIVTAVNEPPALLEQKRLLVEALRGMLKAHEPCTHQTTERRGAIWTECQDCARMWADGENPPDLETSEIKAAREALKAAGEEL